MSSTRQDQDQKAGPDAKSVNQRLSDKEITDKLLECLEIVEDKVSVKNKYLFDSLIKAEKHTDYFKLDKFDPSLSLFSKNKEKLKAFVRAEYAHHKDNSIDMHLLDKSTYETVLQNAKKKPISCTVLFQNHLKGILKLPLIPSFVKPKTIIDFFDKEAKDKNINNKSFRQIDASSPVFDKILTHANGRKLVIAYYQETWSSKAKIRPEIEAKLQSQAEPKKTKAKIEADAMELEIIIPNTRFTTQLLRSLNATSLDPNIQAAKKTMLNELNTYFNTYAVKMESILDTCMTKPDTINVGSSQPNILKHIMNFGPFFLYDIPAFVTPSFMAKVLVSCSDYFLELTVGSRTKTEVQENIRNWLAQGNNQQQFNGAVIKILNEHSPIPEEILRNIHIYAKQSNTATQNVHTQELLTRVNSLIEALAPQTAAVTANSSGPTEAKEAEPAAATTAAPPAEQKAPAPEPAPVAAAPAEQKEPALVAEIKAAEPALSEEEAKAKAKVEKAKRTLDAVITELSETEHSYSADVLALYFHLQTLINRLPKDSPARKLVAEQHITSYREFLQTQRIPGLLLVKKSTESNDQFIQRACHELATRQGELTQLYTSLADRHDKLQKFMDEHKGLTIPNTNGTSAFMVKKGTQEKTLSALSITPVQRVPRYKLLLEQMQKYYLEAHPNHPKNTPTPFDAALASVSAVAQNVNEAYREQEKAKKLQPLLSAISNYIGKNLTDKTKAKNVGLATLMYDQIILNANHLNTNDPTLTELQAELDKASNNRLRSGHIDALYKKVAALPIKVDMPDAELVEDKPVPAASSPREAKVEEPAERTAEDITQAIKAAMAPAPELIAEFESFKPRFADIIDNPANSREVDFELLAEVSAFKIANPYFMEQAKTLTDQHRATLKQNADQEMKSAPSVSLTEMLLTPERYLFSMRYGRLGVTEELKGNKPGRVLNNFSSLLSGEQAAIVLGQINRIVKIVNEIDDLKLNEVSTNSLKSGLRNPDVCDVAEPGLTSKQKTKVLDIRSRAMDASKAIMEEMVLMAKKEYLDPQGNIKKPILDFLKLNAGEIQPMHLISGFCILSPAYLVTQYLGGAIAGPINGLLGNCIGTSDLEKEKFIESRLNLDEPLPALEPVAQPAPAPVQPQVSTSFFERLFDSIKSFVAPSKKSEPNSNTRVNNAVVPQPAAPTDPNAVPAANPSALDASSSQHDPSLVTTNPTKIANTSKSSSSSSFVSRVFSSTAPPAPKQISKIRRDEIDSKLIERWIEPITPTNNKKTSSAKRVPSKEYPKKGEKAFNIFKSGSAQGFGFKEEYTATGAITITPVKVKNQPILTGDDPSIKNELLAYRIIQAFIDRCPGKTMHIMPGHDDDLTLCLGLICRQNKLTYKYHGKNSLQFDAVDTSRKNRIEGINYPITTSVKSAGDMLIRQMEVGEIQALHKRIKTDIESNKIDYKQLKIQEEQLCSFSNRLAPNEPLKIAIDQTLAQLRAIRSAKEAERPDIGRRPISLSQANDRQEPGPGPLPDPDDMPRPGPGPGPGPRRR